jgi:23S rRNA pseudouridine1911/1915/1917 synthase
MRLIDQLRQLGMSNREAKAALASAKIYVKDAPTADPIREVDPVDVEVRVNAPRGAPWRDPIIVWRDAHLAVIAKPAGMLAVPAPGRRGAASVLGVAHRTLGNALAVHRLDEGTSGLMMVARTEACQIGLKELLSQHDVERRYLAVIAGAFPDGPIRRESVLVRDRGDGLRGSAEGPDGKRAVSHFARRRPAGPGRTLVEARLETGRTHQIRIHLSELGYPILGDRLYAPGPVARACARLALHAEILGVVHPITGESLRFEAPLADDLERLIR